MGLLPEREPKKNLYENPQEASALNIERKEVITPVPVHFKAQVTDDNGNSVITTPETKKPDIIIPEVNKEVLEERSKGSSDESNVWSANYWIRIFKKAVFFGWKILFKK